MEESTPQQQVFIFIGQSGCGKGTQAELLKAVFEKQYPDIRTFHLETGKKFRELIASDTYSARRAKSIIEEGHLPPPFLGVHMWSHVLMYDYEGEERIFVDGTPRVPSEVPMLLSAITFYGWKPHVIHLQVSDEWSYARMKGRGRSDDKSEKDLWGRIEWYHTSVIPSIALLRENSLITFHDIQGEQSIEAVHADICHSLNIRI